MCATGRSGRSVRQRGLEFSFKSNLWSGLRDLDGVRHSPGEGVRSSWAKAGNRLTPERRWSHDWLHGSAMVVAVDYSWVWRGEPQPDLLWIEAGPAWRFGS